MTSIFFYKYLISLDKVLQMLSFATLINPGILYFLLPVHRFHQIYKCIVIFIINDFVFCHSIKNMFTLHKLTNRCFIHSLQRYSEKYYNLLTNCLVQQKQYCAVYKCLKDAPVSAADKSLNLTSLYRGCKKLSHTFYIYKKKLNKKSSHVGMLAAIYDRCIFTKAQSKFFLIAYLQLVHLASLEIYVLAQKYIYVTYIKLFI